MYVTTGMHGVGNKQLFFFWPEHEMYRINNVVVTLQDRFCRKIDECYSKAMLRNASHIKWY